MPVPDGQVAVIRERFAMLGYVVTWASVEIFDLGARGIFVLTFTCTRCGQAHKLHADFRTPKAYERFTDSENWIPSALHCLDVAKAHACHPNAPRPKPMLNHPRFTQ